MISGASTCCAQPGSSATRMRRSPSAGKISIQSSGEAAGTRRGASASSGRSSFGANPANGFAEPRQCNAARSRAGLVSTRAEQTPQQPLAQGPAVMLLDMAPAVIDEVHVVHAGRAGRHAGEARQAAVDMLDGLRRDLPAFFEHVLDQVDAAARAVELVAEQHIGRAGRGAEAAMHAGAQDLFRRRGIGVGELGQRELGLQLVSFSRLRSGPCGRG